MKAAASAMVVATFLGALTFVVVYLGRNWRQSAIGRNVMAFMAVITVVSGLAVSSIIFGQQWPYRDLIRALCWGAVAVTIWWRVVLLLRVPRHRQSDADPPG